MKVESKVYKYVAKAVISVNVAPRCSSDVRAVTALATYLYTVISSNYNNTPIVNVEQKKNSWSH